MMSLRNSAQVYQHILDKISCPPDLDSRLRESYDLLNLKLKNAESHLTDAAVLSDAFQCFAEHLNQALQRNILWADQLLSIFADASAEFEDLRPLLGLLKKPSKEINERQYSGEDEPDCILEVARRLVQHHWNSLSADRNRNALRLIANCCADNNINRNIIIRRGGVELLLSIAGAGHQLELIIPTLYNICVDFDEPALDEHGRVLVSLDDPQEPSKPGSDAILTASEQILGRFKHKETGQAVIEVLLDLSEKSSASNLPYLADLVEMASRLGLCNIDQLVCKADNEAKKADFLHLMNALTTKGTNMVLKSAESSSSICQALLNLLSKSQPRKALLELVDGIELFVRLPYIVALDDEDHELGPYQTEFLKLTYQISAMSEYSASYGPMSPLLSSCIQCLRSSRRKSVQSERFGKPVRNTSFLACCCVLLANTITSVERAVQLSSIASIGNLFLDIIRHEDDNIFLSPIIHILTRLSMCAEGQDIIWEAGIPEMISQKLSRKSLTLEIQREMIILLRLAIKDRPVFLNALIPKTTSDHLNNEDSGFFNRIMTQFRKTIDASTKTEIGRLIVEIFRLLVGAAREENQSPEDFEPKLSLIIGQGYQDALDPVAFLIQESRSAYLASEGWFGFGIVSIWSLGRTLILNTILKNNMTQNLEDISKTNQGPNYENLKIVVVKMQSVPKEQIPESLGESLKMISNEMNLGWR